MKCMTKLRIAATALAFVALLPGFGISMNPRVRSLPKDLQEQVFITPEETLPKLTAALVSGVSDTATKVRILHDWICDNIAYDCDAFTVGVNKQDPSSVLQKKKAVCVGYSNLMAVMCYYAGMEAKVIPGWSKGFNYPGYLREESDHAWNVIKIGNRWQQVDVTWDAGYVEYRTFIKRYSTEWLNRKPEEFIYSHLPEEEKWQLLKEPRSPEQFVKEPYIQGIFFDYGFSLGKNAPDYTNYIDGISNFEITQAGATRAVRCELYPADGIERIPLSTWYESYGNRTVATVDVPDGKTYELKFFTKRTDGSRQKKFFSVEEFEQELIPKAWELLNAGKITQKELDFLEPSFFKVEENGRYYPVEDLFATARNNAVLKILKLTDMAGSGNDTILSVEVKAMEGYAGYGNKIRFPVMYDPFLNARGTHLVAPMQGLLKKGESVRMEMASAEFTTLAVVESKESFVFFTKNKKTGRFELDYTVPQAADGISVYGSKDGRNFITLLVFLTE